VLDAQEVKKRLGNMGISVLAVVGYPVSTSAGGPNFAQETGRIGWRWRTARLQTHEIREARRVQPLHGIL
jgi:hypothetical protein